MQNAGVHVNNLQVNGFRANMLEQVSMECECQLHTGSIVVARTESYARAGNVKCWRGRECAATAQSRCEHMKKLMQSHP